jgi:hypothetical protein
MKTIPSLISTRGSKPFPYSINILWKRWRSIGSDRTILKPPVFPGGFFIAYFFQRIIKKYGYVGKKA